MATSRQHRDRVRRGPDRARTRRGGEPPVRSEAPAAPPEQVSEVGPGPTEVPPAPFGPGQPRIVDERHYVGPYGEEQDVVTDDRGRRFYSFRPGADYRYRYDYLGFGWFWWLVVWLCIIGAIVWAWGWGW